MNKIESVEVIPMNKESIFEDEQYIDDETYGVTNNKDEWMVAIQDQFDKMSVLGGGKGVIGGDERLDAFVDSVDTYMLAPAAKMGTSILLAKARKIESLDTLSELDPKRVALYYITEFDNCYVVRYAELDG
jgi:hypothetical protein